MTLKIKLLLILLVLLATFFAGFGTRAYIASKAALQATVDKQQDIIDATKAYADKVDARDAENKKLKDKLDTLDREKTEALNAKQAENSALRSDLAVAQRMRFTGAVCPARPAEGGSGSSGSVGNGEAPELSAEGRQDVFDLRGGIIQLEGQVDYLHGYIERLGLWPPAEEVKSK